ncbi:MAG: hypothetical protein PUJ57_03500 [Peptoniphilaceae bacterium]|nr:hypothetical protein [Peptoniphilaceae bacterium]MDY6085861.1 hypothetical protein [Peptoniphilaceae bacterium]
MLWALLGFVGGFIFLRKGWFIAGSTVIGWFFGRRKAKRQQEKRDAERQRRDFRRFLEALAPRLDAGSNIVEALRFAYTEVTQQDEMSLSHPLMQRIGQLLEAEQNGLSIKSGMKEIAAHNGDWMITSYFESMIIGMVQGADLGALSNAYLRILVEEEQLKSDREARLDAARREQIILFTMPFLLLAVMQLTGLVSNEYRLLDYVMRLVFAVLYGAAWIWSRSILETSGLATRGEK